MKSKRTSNEEIKIAIVKTWKSFSKSIPIIISVLLVISYLQVIVPKEDYVSLFTGNMLIDSFVGAVLGSISLGNPILSYIIGGELLKDGISLIAVTAFLISWVTVGITQLPIEAHFFGKKFAIVRNVTAFFGAMFIGIITYILVGI